MKQTTEESATAWGQSGRQAVIDATKYIAMGEFGYAQQFRALAAECFAKELELRKNLPDSPP
jgi:hypothetical protein